MTVLTGTANPINLQPEDRRFITKEPRMSSFKPFAQAIHARFQEMSAHELFVTAPGDAVWNAYIDAFPAGSNPIFRTRTEHACSCCKHFVRNIGNVVAVIGGKMVSVWDVPGLKSPYKEVAAALNKFVLAAPISDLFRRSDKESSFGAEQTRSMHEGQVETWNHFHAKVANRHISLTPDKTRGDYRTAVQVFMRGLTELSQDSLDTVLELIDDGVLYRGNEHRAAVVEFQRMQTAVALSADPVLFGWANANSPAARFRNTVIGTLVQDLSEGKPLERAVKSFEDKVAPTNYKRPTALVTPGMIKQAMATIDSLGLEPALDRRFAKLSDITINNVLWAASDTRGLMKGALENILADAIATTVPKASSAEDMSIADFIANVLPKCTSMDMAVKNAHANNFVSLTAPVHDGAPRLFKWSNDFAWSYEGNITDSIKERVKKAGGNTDAALRVSLAWFNTDDLDLHALLPNKGHVYFADKKDVLDVDMNNGFGGNLSREPVENLSWKHPAVGTTRVYVHQYRQRETTSPGFVIEVQNNGVIEQYTYSRTLRQDEQVEVGTFVTANGQTTYQMNPAFTGGSISKEVWGVKTETMVKVKTIMHSPNYWDDNAVGNKHTIFVLDGCKNDRPARGIYNEFLSSELSVHSKVFELLGDKTKCQPTGDQLSGLGFSSTRGDKVTVQVRGPKLNKTINVIF